MGRILEKSKMKPKGTATLPDPGYQPTKAEKWEKVKLDAPARNLGERMNNFAKVLMRPAKIRCSNQD